MVHKKGGEQWKLKKHESSKRRRSEDKDEEETDYVYQRPVLNCRKGTTEHNQWDLTQVELNSMRGRNDDFNDDFGQVTSFLFIQFF